MRMIMPDTDVSLPGSQSKEGLTGYELKIFLINTLKCHEPKTI